MSRIFYENRVLEKLNYIRRLNNSGSMWKNCHVIITENAVCI